MTVHRLAGVFVAIAVALGATAAHADAAPSPIALLVPQGVAFSAIGHSCGGIQEQAFATGFDPASTFPVGDVYVQTRCGGSGRGGGYHVTTYSAWLTATWDFTGALVSSAPTAAPPGLDPAFSAFDANNNEVYNTLNVVNGATCSVGNTTYCTYRAWLLLDPSFVPTPRVTAISSQIGPASGNTTITITGTGFTGATGVSFGTTPAASFTIVGDTSITATSAAALGGTVDVTVTSAGGTSATSSVDQFTFVAVPVLTGLSPSQGPLSGGTPVELTGTALGAVTSVMFGDQPAGFVVNSDTSITAYVPAGEAVDTVSVTVTSIGGTSGGLTYSYVPDAPSCTGACVSVGDASILEGDSGTRVMRFVVTLSQAAATKVTVQYATAAGTATGGLDYKDVAGTLAFAAGTVSKIVNVPVIGDTLVEGDETFTLALANPTGGYALARGTGTGTILDDDGIATGVTAGVGDASLVGTAGGTTHLAVPVTLSSPATGSVTISYVLTSGSATYSSLAGGGGTFGGKVTGKLTFAAGTTAKTLSIPIWPNAVANDAAFGITLTNLTGDATLIRSDATGTVLAS